MFFTLEIFFFPLVFFLFYLYFSLKMKQKLVIANKHLFLSLLIFNCHFLFNFTLFITASNFDINGSRVALVMKDSASSPVFKYDFISSL